MMAAKNVKNVATGQVIDCANFLIIKLVFGIHK